MKKLTEIFYNYFYEKVDINDYDNALTALRNVVDAYIPEVENYYVDVDCKFLKHFIKKFYKMKENAEYRYNKIRDYSNSLEGKARPIRRKLISRNAMRELERLYPKFDEFVSIVNQRLNISMINIYYEIQEKEGYKELIKNNKEENTVENKQKTETEDDRFNLQK